MNAKARNEYIQLKKKRYRLLPEELPQALNLVVPGNFLSLESSS
jgi:hypothetical protein